VALRTKTRLGVLITTYNCEEYVGNAMENVGAHQNRQKRAVGTPLISLGPALVADSLCRRKAYDVQARCPNPGFRLI